jgi:hypothetical protein
MANVHPLAAEQEQLTACEEAELDRIQRDISFALQKVAKLRRRLTAHAREADDGR